MHLLDWQQPCPADPTSDQRGDPALESHSQSQGGSRHHDVMVSVGLESGPGLPRAGVHIFRHSTAKLRRDVGESVVNVRHSLDHSLLAVTTVYLRRLEGQEDRAWERVAVALGIMKPGGACYQRLN
jgi:hypothetical protein